MQTIVFRNDGEIDIRSISTFGVSVKESDSPIGFFGTGLKYAIAVLIRTGHAITVQTGMRVAKFSKQTEKVRGQDFDFITMAIDDAAPAVLGFTTELGKQWQLWMAYREIACNCRDEGGRSDRVIDAPMPVEGETRIIVHGDDFAAIHADRHLYMLEDRPASVHGTLEIRRRPSDCFFYRGVRVSDLSKQSLFTYNETSRLDLTEDRTLKNWWQLGNAITRGVMHSDDRQFIRDVVTADMGTFEKDLDFHGWGIQPGEAFLSVIGECAADRVTKINLSALKVWEESTAKTFMPREIALTRVQQASMERALDFCSRIGFQIRDSYPIKVVEALGNGCLGMARNETIFITERVFQLGGTKQLASTLIEEYLHLRQGWADLTRELQSYLFDKVVSLGEELTGEPL